CMCGNATLVMLVSSTCMTVMSITEMVMLHFRAEESVEEGCAGSGAGFARAIGSWGEVSEGGRRPPPSSSGALNAARSVGEMCRPSDGRDLVREVHLAVVLGGIAERPPRAGEAPEAVRVAADAVDDQERDAVLVDDARRLDHSDRLLNL